MMKDLYFTWAQIFIILGRGGGGATVIHSKMQSTLGTRLSRRGTQSLLKRSSTKEFSDFALGEKDLLDNIREDSEPSGSNRHRHHARLENTYRLEPQKTFPYYKARALMTDLLQSTLGGITTYDPDQCAQFATDLSGKIKNIGKDLKIPRYKLISLVHVGEKQEQGLMIGSRCVWNTDHDTFASAQFTSHILYAVAMLYASYLE